MKLLHILLFLSLNSCDDGEKARHRAGHQNADTPVKIAQDRADSVRKSNTLAIRSLENLRKGLFPGPEREGAEKAIAKYEAEIREAEAAVEKAGKD